MPWLPEHLIRLNSIDFKLEGTKNAPLAGRPNEVREMFVYRNKDGISKLVFTVINGVVHDYKVQLYKPDIYYMGAGCEEFNQFLSMLADKGYHPALSLYRQLTIEQILPTL